MKTKKRHLTVVLGSLLGAAMISGVAVAGNPHGTPPGQAKKQASGSASASPSTAAGVKPSSTTNATGHNTNAAASSNQTKLYGNGKTAGQIAMQNGASGSTNLYGPGNSQPHKAVLCPGSKHAVDVHALKAHGHSASCPAGSTSSPTSASTSGSASTAASANASGHVAGAVAVKSGAKANSSNKGGSNSSTGGVLGAQHNGAGSVSGRARPARPVVGAANFTG
jgi:hypothetical protein